MVCVSDDEKFSLEHINFAFVPSMRGLSKEVCTWTDQLDWGFLTCMLAGGFLDCDMHHGY